MNLINLSIRKPITMVMVLLALVVFGIYTFRLLAIDMMPDISLPFVTVQIIYPGSGPEEIETSVVEKLEEPLSQLDGLSEITAYINEGFAFIILEFNMDIDVNIAAMDTKDKVDAMRYQLPGDMENPVIAKFDFGDQPILDLAVFGPGTPDEVRTVAEDIVKEDLSKVTGIALIEVTGGLEREILVELDKQKLQARNIPYELVSGLIAGNNLNFPVGTIKTTRKEINLRVNSQFGSLDELRNLEIPTMSGIVRLKDLGRISDSFKEVKEIARYNKEETVGLGIKKRSDANVVAVADNVIKRIGKLQGKLPEGYRVKVARNNATFIRDSVNDVYSNIGMGVLLTAALLFLFLRALSTTFIAAVTMPVSIVCTFTVIYFSGFTLNVLTLMALGISVGILVTNSIVVLENIMKRMERGGDSASAAEQGTREVAVAVMASTLTNVAVFVPIAFMQSMVGQIFKEFGLTMTYATFFSLLISFTLTPMMASLLLKKKKGAGEQKSGGLMASLQEGYAGLLERILTRTGSALLIILVILLFLSIGVLAPRLGNEFFPKTDQGAFDIKVEMPSGTNVSTTDKVLTDIETRVQEIPELQSQYTTVGVTDGFTGGGNAAKIMVQLCDQADRDRSTERIAAAIRRQLADIPSADITVTPISSMGQGPGTADLEIQVMGSRMEDVLFTMDTLKAVLREIEGPADIFSSWKTGKPEIVFRPKRSALADFGLAAGQVAMSLRKYVFGEAVSTYREGAEEYDITLKYAEKDRKTRTDILSLNLLSPKGQVRLSSLAEAKNEDGPVQISRKNKQRMVTVSSNLLPGYTSGKIQQIIERKMSGIKLPGDARIFFTGENEMMADAMVDFGMAIIMAVVLTYLLLTGLLESFLQPLIIMSTLPLGFIGVIWSLFLTGTSISIMSLMAIVMLIGIVVNNAILILDFSNNLVRRRGVELRRAAIEGAKNKFRAILMTNIATILAMTPLALGLGAGGEIRQPMAVASIGGLIVSTILTLFLIPLLYWMFARFGFKKNA
ncbi:efflux RND transporter permease subunit [Fibrobacterota bacterium]